MEQTLLPSPPERIARVMHSVGSVCLSGCVTKITNIAPIDLIFYKRSIMPTAKSMISKMIGIRIWTEEFI